MPKWMGKTHETLTLPKELLATEENWEEVVFLRKRYTNLLSSAGQSVLTIHTSNTVWTQWLYLWLYKHICIHENMYVQYACNNSEKYVMKLKAGGGAYGSVWRRDVKKETLKLYSNLKSKMILNF